MITHDFDSFPWHAIAKITFLKNEVIIKFLSGSEFSAKPPDKESYAKFLDEARKNLHYSLFEMQQDSK